MKTICTLLAALTLTAACTSSPATSELTESIDSLLTPIFPQDQPGAIALIMRGDSIAYSRTFGMADMTESIPVTDSTLFNICSLSKQFSAIAILKLEEQGLLSVNDTLPKFFPELDTPALRGITLRQLLSHTSGIPDTRPRTESQWKLYRKSHPTRFGTLHDYMRYAPTSESIRYLTTVDSLAFEPGTAYEYQNPTYQLVMPIVESVSGQNFDEWMQTNIFGPAGMTRTVFFDPRRSLPTPFAHGYRHAEGPNTYSYYRTPDGKWEECDYGEALFFPTKADGGLYTTATDFARWERALFGGKIVGQRALALATLPIARTDLDYTSYGLGLFIEMKPDKSRKIFHTGDNGGFLTYEAYFPDRDVFYLIFATHPHWQREQTVEKIDSILKAKHWI